MLAHKQHIQVTKAWSRFRIRSSGIGIWIGFNTTLLEVRSNTSIFLEHYFIKRKKIQVIMKYFWYYFSIIINIFRSFFVFICLCFHIEKLMSEVRLWVQDHNFTTLRKVHVRDTTVIWVCLTPPPSTGINRLEMSLWSFSLSHPWPPPFFLLPNFSIYSIYKHRYGKSSWDG